MSQPLNFKNSANDTNFVSASAVAGSLVTDSGVIDFTGKTTTDPCYFKNGRLLPSVVTNTSNTSITCNLSTNNNFHITTSTALSSLNFSNIITGQSGHIIIENSSANSHSITYTVDSANSTYVKFKDATAPTLSSTSGYIDILSYYVLSSTCILVCDSAGYY